MHVEMKMKSLSWRHSA